MGKLPSGSLKRADHAKTKVLVRLCFLAAMITGLMAWQYRGLIFVGYSETLLSVNIDDDPQKLSESSAADGGSSPQVVALPLPAESAAAPLPREQCTSEALYQDPDKFEKCIVEDHRPTCVPVMTETWDKWAKRKGLPVAAFDKMCITPENVKKLGREWAISGMGSSLRATAAVRAAFPEIFQEYQIKTFMDAPCGDFLWMQQVLANQSSVQYFGGDISAYQIKRSQECHTTTHQHFHVFDWTCKVPPPVDLLMVRDVLFHLSTKSVLDVLHNVNKSGAKYLLTTTFLGGRGDTKPDHFETGGRYGYRNIHLRAPPYNFPEPLKTIDEGRSRYMALYKLPIDTISYS